MRRPATDINTKQRRILDFIKDSLHNEYRCPTVREMVYAMKELNNISDSGTLVPGTVLKVPAHKSNSPVRALDYVAQN